jgi:hypothetical protein
MSEATNAHALVRLKRTHLYALAIILLLLFASFHLIANARSQLLNVDELLGASLITQPTAAALIHFECSTPIWFDPPAFALLVHASWKAFGDGELALRLPSIVSMVLFLCALSRLLYKIAGPRSTFAVLLLTLGQPVIAFGWLQRPYALILAMTSIAALCWYDATRPAPQRSAPRWLSLPCLALALALAINSHYFAVFTLLPFFLAESVRLFQRRRLDLPVLAALVLACSSMLLTLPFVPAVDLYASHVITGELTGRQVPKTYELTLNIPPLLYHLHLVTVCLITMVTIAVIGSAWRLFQTPKAAPSTLQTLHPDAPLWTLIAALTLTPLVTVAFAIVYLHAYRDRYTAYHFIGLMLSLGILAAPWLNRMPRPIYAIVLAVLCLLGPGNLIHLTHKLQAEALAERAAMGPPLAVRSLLQRDPSLPIFAPLETCLKEFRYGSALVHHHLHCVYSMQRELHFGATDTAFRTSLVLAAQGLPMVPYDDLLSTPGPRLFVHRDREPWQDWLQASLTADGIHTSPLGPGLSGDVLLLSPTP